jgi:ribonuclease HII
MHGMALVAGIDEAGRGPVLGPMVLCLAISEEEEEPRLKGIGVKDSKLLRPEARERLSGEIRKVCKLHVAKVTAKELNVKMKAKSLNAIEADVMTDLLLGVSKADMEQIEKIFIDVPDPIPIKFVWRLRLPKDIKKKIHAAHKADVRFPICSAASIIAKVTRDEEIEKIKKELGCNFGTGYSHDAATIECVEKNIENPILKKYLRTEWKTTKNIIKRMKFKTKQVTLENL